MTIETTDIIKILKIAISVQEKHSDYGMCNSLIVGVLRYYGDCPHFVPPKLLKTFRVSNSLMRWWHKNKGWWYPRNEEGQQKRLKHLRNALKKWENKNII